MRNSSKVILFAMGCGIMTILFSAAPASAITAELAKKCRAMAFKAYPPGRIGTKTGNRHAASVYYKTCLDNNGNMPDSDTQSPPPSK